MKMDSIVIVNLQNPKERFFGRLVEITSPGVTIRGIDINAFEDWMDHITHNEEHGVQPTTVFFPHHRVRSRKGNRPGDGSLQSDRREVDGAGRYEFKTARDHQERNEAPL